MSDEKGWVIVCVVLIVVGGVAATKGCEAHEQTERACITASDKTPEALRACEGVYR